MKGRWALRLVLGVVAMCLAIPTALGDEKTPLDKELDQVWGKERDIKVIEKRLLDDAENGGIILIHDGVQQTIDVLPKIIETLQKRGYKFVTVDEMMAKK